MPVLVLIAVASAQALPVDPAPTGFWAASTPQLAAKLLPPELAADSVSHVVSKPLVHGGPPTSVKFDGRAQESNGFCSRKTYYVSNFRVAGGRVVPTAPMVGDKIRLGGCAGVFAHVNPGTDVEQAKMALRWMNWAVHVAKSGAPLPFAVSCSDEMLFDEDRCASGARAALARLPLDKVFIITREWQGRWELAVTETSPGELLWDVAIDAAPAKHSIDLTWKIPPPF